MNRRDALSRVALLLGSTVIGAEFFLNGCTTADQKVGQSIDFTPEDIAYLDEVAETIIPQTDTPGAKAAKVGTFMTVMVRDCYDEKNQKRPIERSPPFLSSCVFWIVDIRSCINGEDNCLKDNEQEDDRFCGRMNQNVAQLLSDFAFRWKYAQRFTLERIR